MARDLRSWLENLLAQADIRMDGSRPWDMRDVDPSVPGRVAAEGNLGLGEAYMDGLWQCDDLEGFFHRVLSARLHRQVKPNLAILAQVAKAKLMNLQNRELSRKVAEIHYNLGNEFYAAMLDPWMQYTCAYWEGGARDLEQAQEAKLELVCRKIGLKPGDRVLELGCGWGGFARYAASRHGAVVTAYNISTEQVAFARERCQGLPVEIRLSDYRDATGEFDKVVSIGMCEHVGPKNYRAFLQLAHDRLVEGGIFLLHSIAGNKVEVGMDAWLDKYIFPGAVLPSPGNLGKALDGLFVLEDWHNFGVDYDRTLVAWRERFEASWPRFREQYGDRFHRMWIYYLACCAGTFRSRYNQLFQLTLSKGGVPGGWRPVR
jgi:cyclopropane-fatty-acyl-phospholipid synthase